MEYKIVKICRNFSSIAGCNKHSLCSIIPAVNNERKEERMFGAYDRAKYEERFAQLVEILGGSSSPVPTSAPKAHREAMGLSQHQLRE